MAITLDSPRLRKLTRSRIQSLAKRETVRAVGKTEDIIRRLIEKHPGGVPVDGDTDNSSVSSAREITNNSGEAGSLLAPVVETTPDGADSKAKAQGEPSASAPSPCSSPSSSVETLRLLFPEDSPIPGPSTANWDPEGASVPHPEAAETETQTDHRPTEPITFSGGLSPVPPLEPPRYYLRTHTVDRNARSDAPQLPVATIPAGRRADDEDEEWGHDEAYDNGTNSGPSRHALVDTLRRCTSLVNANPVMQTRLAESRRLLQRCETMLDKTTPDIRELVVMREYLEVFTLGRMKLKPEIWDGTGRMPKPARKLRMDWLRATRRREAETKWKEANELNRQQNRSPEPFSAFAVGLESDEEEIESLQTTPASSQNGRAGSSKRAREESVDDADAELNRDEGDRHGKKRARS